MNKENSYLSFFRFVRTFVAKYSAKFLPHREITDNLLRSIPLWIASLLAGLVAVLYTKIFAFAEQLGLNLFAQTPWLTFILTPICFLLSWLIVRRFAPFARGSGIPQVMAAIEIGGTEQKEKVSLLVNFRIIVVKIISSIILVFGGGAVGREGPTIHIAGSIFRLVNKALPANWPKLTERMMILTGSAAGLAAAFNTPLGGVVFAIEELGKTHFSTFRTTLLTAVIIAGMTAQLLLGPYLYLGYPNASGLVVALTAPVLLVAVAVSVIGAFFCKGILMIIAAKRKQRTFRSQVFFVLVLSLVIAAIGFWITPTIFGSGKGIMVNLLFGENKTPDLLLAPARVIGPLVSFTSGGAGGVFAPALSGGAAIGAWIAGLFTLTPDQANVLMLAGMVAFLTAVTRSPFTSSILVLEMTDRHSLIFFLMFAGLVGYGTAWLVDKHSLYEQLMEGYVKEVTNPSEPITE